MEAINFIQTGGQFGTKRVLGTFTLRAHTNGRIIVSDDRSNQDVGFGFKTVDEAVARFKAEDDRRLCNR